MSVWVVAEFSGSVTSFFKYYCIIQDFFLRVSEVNILPLVQKWYVWRENCYNSAKTFQKNLIMEIKFFNTSLNRTEHCRKGGVIGCYVATISSALRGEAWQ
jgi:hypothetical protein